MIKNIYSIAQAKGCQIIKTRKCIYLPIIDSYIWLPIWLTWEPEFLTKKGCRYTLDGFLFKIQRKADRKRTKKKIARNRKALNEYFTLQPA